jgi:hypothetical protein
MDTDIEALIGPAKKDAPERPSTRTSRQERVAATLDKLVKDRRPEDMDSAPSLDMTDTFGGVTVYWLAKVFSMDPSDVKRRLADCPPLHKRKAGYVYSLPVAARFLVKPVFDVKAYLAKMKPSELPPQLQSEFWDARLKQQKWEENAKHLWRSEDVLSVFADVFKNMKFTMQLWVDDLAEEKGITQEQRAYVTARVDALQAEIYEGLVKQHRTSTTPSSIDELTDFEVEQDVAHLL